MGRIRLMLADDEEVVLDAMRGLVSTDPFIDLVGTARDAAEAIDLAALHEPDVAVLDVRMPGGGARAAREIRRCSPETSVVALSASTDPRSVVSMLRAGAVGYVGKDQSAEEFLRAIHRSAVGRASIVVERLGEVAERLAEHQARLADRQPGRSRITVARIRSAIEGTGLDIVFQPIVDLGNGEVRGLESLARFRSRPRHSPEVWFAEASNHGLMQELELAAAARGVDRANGLPDGVFVSVNLSVETLRSPGLVEVLERAPARRVVLELTEGSPVVDLRETSTRIGELRAMGCRLAVDDVGRGFSGLGNVVALSPELLKLDRSLVTGIDRDRAKRGLVSRLASFADEIGTEVVAEGIETEAELGTVRSLGIRTGQGFLLGRPGPIPPLVDGSLVWPRRRHLFG